MPRRAHACLIVGLTALGPACPGWWTPVSDSGLSALEGPCFEQSQCGAPLECVTNGCVFPGPADTSTTGLTDASTSLPTEDSAANDSTGEDPSAGGSTTGTDLPQIDDAWCDVFDADQVHFLGTFTPGGAGTDALARPDQPRAPCVGFADTPRLLRIRPTDGRLLWTGVFYAEGVYVFTPDELRWDKFDERWDYPQFPYDNDETIPTDQCESVWEFLIHPGDGTIVYGCPDDQAEMAYYDQAGALVYASGADDSQQNLLAIADDGTFLLRSNANYEVGKVRYLPPGQLDSLPITLPMDAVPEGDKMWTARARGDGSGGFWAVVKPFSGSPQRWTISVDGVAAVDGSYDVLDEIPDYPIRLTGDGDIVYPLDAFKGVQIVRSPLLPGRAAILYDEDDAPESLWPFEPEPPFVFAFTLELFTGP